MKNISRRDAFRVLAGGAVAMAGSAALAQEPVAHQEYLVIGEAPRVEAARQLEDVTKEGGVGIILAYKAWEGGPDAGQIASAYIAEFEKNQTLADFRVVESDKPGLAVTYLIKDTAQGPFDPNAAYAMIPDIAAQNKFAHGVESAELDLPDSAPGS